MTASNFHGLLLLNKKSGFTSFDSLAGVKKAFATGKAGHTGTLDKFASGLLLVLVGRGVKLAPLFSGCSKQYTGTIFFGAETDTLDPEGAVIAEAPVPAREDVEAVLDAFRGGILQAPPAFSAVHIEGRRAHELARGGQSPEMKKRPVTIHSLELLSWTPPTAQIAVHCSAGTYIRSLARDIALAAGSRAYLSALVRTRVGSFRLEDSVEDERDRENLIKALRPLDRKLFETLSLSYFLIEGRAVEGFLHGKPLAGILPEGEYVSHVPGGVPEAAEGAAFAGVFGKKASGVIPGEADGLLGILERGNGTWRYGHVFPPVHTD